MCNKCPMCKCSKEYYGQNDKCRPESRSNLSSIHDLFEKLEETLQEGFDEIHEAIEELHEKVDELSEESEGE